MLNYFILIAGIISTSVLCGQEYSIDTTESKLIDRLSLDVYGTVLYNNYDWETDTTRRNNVDMNHIVFAPTFQISDKLALEMEIEFEHGGTGSSMEFDKFEEFGEYEQEVEHGGEVVIEELELGWKIKPWLELKAGKIKVPVGLANYYYKPVDYLTTTYNNVEETFLPVGWYEVGIGAGGEFGRHQKLSYQFAIINALDNSAFSSANWIKRGSFQKFEYSNAESFATALRLDYKLNDKSVVGIAAYAGNSTPNRPKPDIRVDSWVTVEDMHLHFENDRLYLQAISVYGTLQNASLISDANKNLSNNLNVKRTPIGSAVFGNFIEAGYDVLPFICKKPGLSKLYFFGGYYYYDTMYKTSGTTFNNPRWERKEIRTGLNYQWNNSVGLKTDFTSRKINLPENNMENTFTIAITFNI